MLLDIVSIVVAIKYKNTVFFRWYGNFFLEKFGFSKKGLYICGVNDYDPR